MIKKSYIVLIFLFITITIILFINIYINKNILKLFVYKDIYINETYLIKLKTNKTLEISKGERRQNKEFFIKNKEFRYKLKLSENQYNKIIECADIIYSFDKIIDEDDFLGGTTVKLLYKNKIYHYNLLAYDIIPVEIQRVINIIYDEIEIIKTRLDNY